MQQTDKTRFDRGFEFMALTRWFGEVLDSRARSGETEICDDGRTGRGEFHRTSHQLPQDCNMTAPIL
jgi:hypothetical protein